ncbi:MAG: peptidoglycan-binding protein [Richelia sp. CSU_2_1]|nr:peptidoglycan-binding protein [Richelia sp. CSU_2_1]
MKVLKPDLVETISGEFDEATESAVESFQEDANITVDGKVDETTWAALVERFEPIWNQGDREFKQLLENVIAAQTLAESAKTAAETG